MTVNSPGTNQGSAQSSAAAGQQPQQANIPNQSQQKWSFHQKMFRAPIGAGMGSEALTTLYEALTENYKAADSRFEITLIPIDNTNETNYFSVIVVCVKEKAFPKTGVVFHSLILEATATPPQPLNEQFNGQNVKVLVLASDAYDKKLDALITERVRKNFPGVPVWTTLATVVPRGFDTKDKNAIHRLALTAGIATITELTVRNENFSDLNLALLTHDSKLQAQLTFSKDQIENSVSEVIRADVSVNFRAELASYQQNQSLNAEDRGVDISRVSGFIDLIYAPVAPQQNMFGTYPGVNPGFGPGMQMPTQQYGARFIITQMMMQGGNTLGSMLLALVSSTAVSSNGNWMQALKPVPRGKKGVDLHDIGAIGIEVQATDGQFGKRFDTSADHFRNENLGQMMMAYFRQGLVISMDIPDAGPDTWANGVFSAASGGSNEACEAIYNAAERLTNGAFKKHFPAGTQMFTDLGNRVHLGYWVSEDGKRDIRDIDYLAVANLLGEQDPRQIRSWSDTFTQTNYPINLRLQARERIITERIPSAVITGWANRVTFREQFIVALTSACKEAGLDIQILSPMSGDMNNSRGVGSFITDAMMPIQTPGLFNQNGGMGMGNSGSMSTPGFNPMYR